MASRKPIKKSRVKNGSGLHSEPVAFLKSRHEAVRQSAGEMGTFSINRENLEKLRSFGLLWLSLVDLKSEFVYPALQQENHSELIEDVIIESDLVTLLLADLASRRLDDPWFPAVVRALLKHARSVIDLEESDPDGVFSTSRTAEADLKELRAVLSSKSGAENSAEDDFREPSPRYLRGGTSTRSKENDMRGYERERDERGRFVEDDDHRGRRFGSQGLGRHRDDHDDEHRRDMYESDRGYRSSSYERDDDSWHRGRHDDDDDRRYGYGQASRRNDDDRRRSRYREDDDYRGSRRGSGWYGDSEGHSRAAQRGWDNPDHGRSGWFGDSEGHSRASERGWDNPDHGRSGWFGDHEGHSRASQRGWDDRRRSDRYRDEDDDYRRRRRY
ncbi:MAG: hypothetical protein R3D33_13520 [Hyphomicrobiaceae bacterium]